MLDVGGCMFELCEWLSKTSALSGAARVGSGCAAGGAAKLPGGPGGQLWSLGVAGETQESC